MATLARPAPVRTAPLARPAPSTALVLLIAAFLIRCVHFGDPAYQMDEEFYLLVGDRMLHGALPFVDIWDRKPIGLFLIYAGIRLLGGEGIYQYQVVACLFATATAWIIHRIALPRAGHLGGIAAGLLYLLWIETVEGGGGQSPIFYNPLIAGSAWCTLKAVGAETRHLFLRRAYGAMALAGIAIQIKYTAVFEGFFFGLVLAWWTLRHSTGFAVCLGHIVFLAATALVPTLAALGFYAAIGQFDAFWFANFTSIFLRRPDSPVGDRARLLDDLRHIVILSACLGASMWSLRRDAGAECRRWIGFLIGWTIFAAIGFLSVGLYYCHYLLPLYVPLAIGASPVFRLRPVGIVMAGVAMWIPFHNLSYPDFTTRAQSRQRIAAMMAMIPSDVTRGCMQILEGPPILYTLAHACMLSRYVFPEHLIGPVEKPAIGVNQAVELARILRLRPRTIVVNARDATGNPIVREALAQAYRRAGSVMFDDRTVEIWVTRAPR